MSERPPATGPWARGMGGIAFLVVAALLVLGGHGLMFSTFMEYDDEGYVLLSLRNYGEHGHLYDRVFSQYGPFFFALYDGLHRLLGFEWTHAHGRTLTWSVWVLTAAICALAVGRRTRSFPAAGLTLAGVFTSLWVMVNEPTHPGGLVGLLLAAAVLAGLEADPARSRAAAAVVGAIAGALSLTKINAGGFLTVAAAAWLGRQAPPRWRRLLSGLAAAGLVTLPWTLTQPLWGEAWVRELAILSCLASSSVWLALRDEQAIGGRPATGAFTAGFVVVAAATLVLTLARGTTLAGLIQGIVLGPLRQPAVYNHPFAWWPGALMIALVGFATTVWWASGRARNAARWWVAAIRLLLAAGLLLSMARLLPFGAETIGMNAAVALAGVCALPVRTDEAGAPETRGRQWIALLLVLQLLHVYPVAGSQVSWAVFLWVPLVVLAIRDAGIALAAGRPGIWRALPRLAAVLAFAGAAVAAARQWQESRSYRQEGEALGLPGTEGLVLPDQPAFALRAVAANVKAHGSMLMTLPGQYSFNLWTDVPTATLANANQWFISLSDGQQQAIIDRLRPEPRAVLVVQLQDLAYLEGRGFRPQGPLAGFLGAEFEGVFAMDSYGFFVRRGRAVAPLGTAAVGAGEDGGRRLELVAMLPAEPIATIELWELGDGSRRRLHVLDPSNASLDVTPLDEAGRATAPAITGAWNAALPAGPAAVAVVFPGEIERPTALVAFVKAAGGRRLAEARVLR